MDDLNAIETALADLAQRIEETRARLPAHSVKPPVMMELLELEDAYDRLFALRQALTQGPRGHDA